MRRIRMLVLAATLSVLGVRMPVERACGEEPIAWQHDLQEAFKQAQEAHRPLLIFLGKEHCPHCVHMKTETLGDQKVVERLNRDYVNLQLDGPQHSSLVHRMGVRIYPTILVVSPENRLLGKIDGFVTAQSLEVRLAATRQTRTAATRAEPAR